MDTAYVRPGKRSHTRMSWDGSDRINGDVRINGLDLSPTYKWGMNWGEITH